jgi:hypothetical protein
MIITKKEQLLEMGLLSHQLDDKTPPSLGNIEYITQKIADLKATAEQFADQARDLDILVDLNKFYEAVRAALSSAREQAGDVALLLALQIENPDKPAEYGANLRIDIIRVWFTELDQFIGSGIRFNRTMGNGIPLFEQI